MKKAATQVSGFFALSSTAGWLQRADKARDKNVHRRFRLAEDQPAGN